MRKQFLPFHLPSIGDEEISEVVDTMRSGWLTTGSKTSRFEEAFSAYIGARHAIAVNSGTAALHLALAATGLSEGDQVIVPTLTFAATAEAVCYMGGIPRFVDVDPHTLTIDVEQAAALIEKGGDDGKPFRAIIPVHFGGVSCDMDPILDLARRHGLAVIEDAAHALPTTYRGRMVGTIGDITAFSFYATKSITTGEGGMITTDDDQRAERMRMMSLHGMTKDAWKRYGRGGSWYYEIAHLGYKYNLTDIASAIGIGQLEQCDAFHARRREIAHRYTAGFRGIHGIDLPRSTHDLLDTGREATMHAWHLYPILVDDKVLSINRAAFIEALKARNIGTSVHFIPLHMQPFYRDRYGYKEGDFPEAEAFYGRCISLPIYPAMTDVDIDDVIEAVRLIAGESGR